MVVHGTVYPLVKTFPSAEHSQSKDQAGQSYGDREQARVILATSYSLMLPVMTWACRSGRWLSMAVRQRELRSF